MTETKLLEEEKIQQENETSPLLFSASENFEDASEKEPNEVCHEDITKTIEYFERERQKEGGEVESKTIEAQANEERGTRADSENTLPETKENECEYCTDESSCISGTSCEVPSHFENQTNADEHMQCETLICVAEEEPEIKSATEVNTIEVKEEEGEHVESIKQLNEQNGRDDDYKVSLLSIYK